MTDRRAKTLTRMDARTFEVLNVQPSMKPVDGICLINDKTPCLVHRRATSLTITTAGTAPRSLDLPDSLRGGPGVVANRSYGGIVLSSATESDIETIFVDLNGEVVWRRSQPVFGATDRLVRTAITSLSDVIVVVTQQTKSLLIQGLSWTGQLVQSHDIDFQPLSTQTDAGNKPDLIDYMMNVTSVAKSRLILISIYLVTRSWGYRRLLIAFSTSQPFEPRVFGIPPTTAQVEPLGSGRLLGLTRDIASKTETLTTFEEPIWLTGQRLSPIL
jgi:hypothetical protein